MWLIAALAFAPSSADAQALALQYQQVLTRTMPGATAAFSLDPSRVGASASDGEVTLVGRGPGATNVVVVIGDRTESFQVSVSDPPTIFRPGRIDARSTAAESGHYEVRYGSDPGVLQGNLRFSRREGDRSTELAIGGAAPFGGASVSPFSIPLASYTFRSPGREITLLDGVVTNSPLTVSRSNVRGLHLREGPWQLHAGYSFFGNFEHLLLPTDSESVAGIGYRHTLTSRSSLTSNVYYFDAAPHSGRSGALGTLFYEARPRPDVKLAAEIGVSRAVGGALEIDVDRPGRRGWARLRFAPPGLPSLTTDQQSGRHLEGGWTAHGDVLSVNGSVASRSYGRGTSAHTSNVASLTVRRYLTTSWSIHGGPGYSLFDSAAPGAPRVHSVTLPVGTAFTRRHIGLGVDYQFSRETTRDLAGHLFRANVNVTSGGFRFSMHGERQTHAPTAQYIFSEAPWLQPMLDRLGLAAQTPEQIAELLQTNAELAAYGYANSLTIDLTPMRTRAGASAGWSGSGALAPQLFASTLVNRDELIDRTSLSAVHSLTYSQRLGDATEIFFTSSALCDGGHVLSSCRPAMFVSLRRALSGAPGILPRRHGTIDGIVFRDDIGRGVYSPELPILAGVEVVLDGVRHARTDVSGRFVFDAVPYGRHRVEARYASDQPTFFTTPSPADVDADASVNFGIGRALSSVRGTVRADAGGGLSGVVVHIAGGDRETTARTADEGSFIAEGLPAGVYDVAIEAGSVPAGYPVDAVVSQRVEVGKTMPGRATFVLQPYRSVSGRARLFDRERGQYVALAGTTVELKPLGRQSVTDGNGLYTFRDLPPGEYTVVAAHKGQEFIAAVSVPDGPTFMKDIDVAVVPRGDGVTGGGPLRAAASPARTTTADARPARVTAETRERKAPRTAADSHDRIEGTERGGSFTIEVAASPSERHAHAMVDELKDAGHAAYLVEPPSSRPVVSYHVFVGRYRTIAEADSSARALEKILGWRLRVTAVAQGG